jgi:hypothetical protein
MGLVGGERQSGPKGMVAEILCRHRPRNARPASRRDARLRPLDTSLRVPTAKGETPMIFASVVIVSCPGSGRFVSS